MSETETPLTVAVKNGEIVIRIGVNVLAHAIANGDAFHNYDGEETYFRNFAITNAEQFAREVANKIEAEEEDGSSLLSNMLENAAQEAIGDGGDGIEYGQHIKYGEKLPSEKW